MDKIPPMSPLAKRLLELDKDSRNDPRVLALIAQRDPVLLAKVLAQANSALYANLSLKPVANVEAAIRILGVATTYSTMLMTALCDSFPKTEEREHINKFLLRHTFTKWLTGRNLGRYLRLPEDVFAITQLATLFEVLGVYAGLLFHDELSYRIAAQIELVLAEGRTPTCEEADIVEYQPISAEIADSWGAPPEVAKALRDRTSSSGVLLHAVYALIHAKLNNEPQLEALQEALSGTPWLNSVKLPRALDLVVLA